MRFIISIVIALCILLAEPTIVLSGDKITGTASNYPGTAGFMGMAGVAMPGALGGRYTGSINGYVTVCGDRCAVLPIIDWCQCYWDTSDQRIVDLNYEAWALVSDEPLSRGLITVTVELAGAAPNPLPNTRMP